MSDLPNALPPEDEGADLGEVVDDELPPEEEEGGEDAEGGDEPPEAAAGEEPQPRERSRRSETRSQLRRERNAERQRVADLERQIAEIRQNQQRPAVDPYAQQRAEQEFLASLQQMDPYQAAIAVRDRERQMFAGVIQNVRTELREGQDQQAFAALTRSDPMARELAPEVERLIAAERAQGNYTTTRQVAYELLYGRMMLERRQAQAPRQRAAAQQRIRQQTTQPASARGDVAAGRRQPSNETDAARERLRNSGLGFLA